MDRSKDTACISAETPTGNKEGKNGKGMV
jgi:hypothetical protein